ncbi:helicase RepA family protein [bacterium]|nr:helicase RepA family protein [bacterium]
MSEKAGSQRGHSGKEDALSWSIEMTHPSDYVADQGARFVVRFTKMRGNHAVPPFEAWLKDGRWEVKQLEDIAATRIIELARENLSARAIEKRLQEEGTPKGKSSVSRIIQKAQAEGIM